MVLKFVRDQGDSEGLKEELVRQRFQQGSGSLLLA